MSETIAQFITAVVSRLRSREDRGATAVEYGLLVGLIAVAIIVTVGLLGTRLNVLFGQVLTAIGG